MLEIDPEKVCYIILRARQLQAQDPAPEEGPAPPRPVDEDDLDVLATQTDDPALQELTDWVESLNLDEQCQLVALAWLGRGDYAREDWAEALEIAQERHTEHTGEYLLGMPLIADYLEEGLAQLDLSCEGVEAP